MAWPLLRALTATRSDVDSAHGPSPARLRALFVVSAAALLLWICAGAVAAWGTSPERQVHPRFHALSTQALVASESYVFLLRSAANGQQSGGTLINARTGSRISVPPAPDCAWIVGAPLVGGHKLLFNCSTTSDGGAPVFDVFDVRARAWGHVGTARSIQSQCAAMTYPGGCSGQAVGDRWIEVVEQCYHCQAAHVFENLVNGSVSPMPKLDRRQVLDLNNKNLIRVLCQPVQVPNSGQAIPEGRFFVMAGRQGLLVQECGSRQTHLLTRRAVTFAATAGAVVWTTAAHPHVIQWRTLNRARGLSIQLPGQISSPSEMVLSGQRLYVYDGRSWTATLPTTA